MQLKSGRHVVKLLYFYAALLGACSADSGRDAGPRRVGGGGAPALVTPETTPAGAPTSGDGLGNGGNEGFPDFGDIAETPPEDGPLTPRTDCGSGPPTTVRGTIYDPAGRLPLYNVMVYVPSAELDPIVEGVSCDRCDTTASGRPVAAAITDPSGQFVMENVPDGSNIPLVIQMGKWRRQITLPEVRPCQENAFDDRDQLRLPRNQSEGHLPKIAMTTGSADKLECLLRLIGVADSEFTTPEGSGRVNLFHETGTESLASGQTLPAATTLLGSTLALSQYDVVILSCHGDSGYGRDQPTTEKDAMLAYLDQGGRAFGSHFYFSYLRADDDNHLATPFPDVGVWDGDAPETYSITTNFPKGQAFAQWLVNVGASSTFGSIALESVEGAASLLETPNTQSWISAPNSVPYFSLNLPIEAASAETQCGRFVHTGIHVSEGEESPFPTGCDESRELTPQEMALEFLLFDLSACPSNLEEPPLPPPVFEPR